MLGKAFAGVHEEAHSLTGADSYRRGNLEALLVLPKRGGPRRCSSPGVCRRCSGAGEGRAFVVLSFLQMNAETLQVPL